MKGRNERKRKETWEECIEFCLLVCPDIKAFLKQRNGIPLQERREDEDAVHTCTQSVDFSSYVVSFWTEKPDYGPYFVNIGESEER